MKKLKYIVFLLSLILCFSGCNKKQTKNQKEENLVQYSDSINSKLYGKWIIEEDITPDGVMCLDMDYLVGTEIILDNDYIIFNGETYYIQNTREENWDRERLFKETSGTGSRGLLFESLGLTGDMITFLEFKEKNNKRFTFMIGENKVIFFNGNCFLLKRG